ncbi:MAG TPA: DUF520 family protein, partial [Pseudomonadales bacterium]
MPPPARTPPSATAICPPVTGSSSQVRHVNYVIMPSFDVVSQVNLDEVRNAVNQAAREISTRFDFKGKNASFELDESRITMRAPDEFQLGQMYDILTNKLASRKVNVACLQREPV